MARVFNSISKFLSPNDEYEDYDDYDEEEEREAEQPAPSKRSSTKVVPINHKSQLQVIVYKPRTYKDDTANIAKSLLTNCAVVVNLEKTDKVEARRILDFLSGIAFAVNGRLSSVASSTYMITPINVELSGEDLFDEFENSNVYF